jgi:predicted transcriptional regulator
MSSEERSAEPSNGPRPQLRLTDPKAMRAMAHPTRLALLDALTVREPLTATEAAEIVGESPTNCAFHLRTLAKYGFVEETPGGSGRRRPWRRTHSGYSLKEVELEGAEAKLAAEALVGVAVTRWLERIRAALSRRASFPAQWRKLTDFSTSLLFVTPEEAERLQKDMVELMRPYFERADDPDSRPPDAIPVEVFHFSFPHEASNPQDG